MTGKHMPVVQESFVLSEECQAQRWRRGVAILAADTHQMEDLTSHPPSRSLR